MGQTRVNLQHLLEDLRDAYPNPIHEAVLTELVANALDSGASSIHVRIAYDPPRLEFLDDGAGMSRRELETYHDIAATSKHRGQGIGFAGVGAKLSLLICREVLTETRRGSFHGATRWWLQSPSLAPWTEEPPRSLLSSATGTAVTLHLETLDNALLDADQARRTLIDHFEPLFDPDLGRFLYLYYPGGVRFWVDDEELVPSRPDGVEETQAEVAGTRRRPLGMVRLRVAPEPLDEARQGLAVSVLGKVVKRGWEWLGMVPEHPDLVSGVVEVPSLVSILTTNKADFLRDAASLQRFYKVRKQVQNTVAGLLRDLGELPGRRSRARDLRPVERELGRVLDRILEAFPELEPLLERRRGWERAAALVADEGDTAGDAMGSAVRPTEQGLPGLDLEPSSEGERPSPSQGGDQEMEARGGGAESGTAANARRRRPGLSLAWVDEPERRDEMSWLDGAVLAINRAHPAFARARGPAAERLYLVTAIATALARELEAGHDPLRFTSQFLARWGERGETGTSGGGALSGASS